MQKKKWFGDKGGKTEDDIRCAFCVFHHRGQSCFISPLHSAVFPRHSGRTPRHVRLIASLFHYPAHCLFLLTFPFPLRRKDEGGKKSQRDEMNFCGARNASTHTHTHTRALPPTPSLTADGPLCAHAAACSRARANPQEVFKCVRQKYARIVAHWTAALSERKEGRTEGRRE